MVNPYFKNLGPRHLISPPFKYPYEIDYSCRFNVADTTSMSQTFGSPTDADTWSFSFWVKRKGPFDSAMRILNAYTNATNYSYVAFTSGSAILYRNVISGSVEAQVTTNSIFRDEGEWYHFLATLDQANQDLKIYANGTQLTLTESTPVSATAGLINNNAIAHYIGMLGSGANYLEGYLSEVHFIDGQELTPSSFGQTYRGVWVPIEYTGTYGNNGFYLDFADSADLGDDESGNANDWTESNLATNDQMADTPTNNYPTIWYENVNDASTDKTDIKDGGLVYEAGDATTDEVYMTHVLPQSGKYYMEFLISGVVSHTNNRISFLKNQDAVYFLATYHSNGDAIIDGVSSVGWGDAWANETISAAVDIDAGTVEWFTENVSQGVQTVASGLGGAIIALRFTDTSFKYTVKFGQNGFSFDPPTGYKHLSSKNIPPLLGVSDNFRDGERGFKTVIYEGTGAEKTITGLEFQPDLIWIKNRDATDEHVIVDSARGATKEINSDSNNAESTEAQGVKTINSDGFTLGTKAEYNTSSESYVAWCWKADPRYGFDIVTYTGTGAAHAETHNLGGVPELIFVKSLDNAYSWAVYHDQLNQGSTPEDYYLVLDTNAAEVDDATYWNDTAPTATGFTVGTNNSTNKSGERYVAYLWRSIPGFSKTYSFVGNGLGVDNESIFLDFKPAFIFYKARTTTGPWVLIDAARDIDNPTNVYLQGDTTDGDTSLDVIDFCSNGVKTRANFGGANYFLGILFAETPHQYARAR